MASDLDATIEFWRDGFGGEVVHDVEFAGARNADVVESPRALGHSVTEIRREPAAAYAMAQGPDRLLVEISQPDLSAMGRALRAYFDA